MSQPLDHGSSKKKQPIADGPIPQSKFRTWAGATDIPEMTVLADHPASGHETAPDKLQLESRLSAVFDILRHKQTRCPITVAIYGDWGTGKTSAMRWLETQLKSWNEVLPEYRGKHPRVYPIWFDPWRYHSREEVWRGIIAEVILSLFSVRELDRENAPTRMREAAKLFGSFLGRGFLHALANLELNIGPKGSGEVKLKGEVFRDIYDEYDKAAHPAKAHLNQFEETLKSWISRFLKSNGGVFSERLAIFIDDLDRCLPDVTLEVLEAIKLYLNIDPLVFVIGVDRLVVDGLVRKRYLDSGVSELKSREYLNKIFQVEVQIPPSEAQMEIYLEGQIDAIDNGTGGFWKKMLGGRNAVSRKAVEEGVRQLSRHNPREVKRLLNSALLAGRGLAASEGGGTPEARSLRFVQGVQFFLLQRLVHDRVSESSQLLLKRQTLEWFEQLSQFAVDHPEYQPTTEDLSESLSEAVTTGDVHKRKRPEGKPSLQLNSVRRLKKILLERPTNDLGAVIDLSFFANATLWCLLRIQFSAEAAQFARRAAQVIPPARIEPPPATNDLGKTNLSAEITATIRDRVASQVKKPVGELTANDVLQVRSLSLESASITEADLQSLSSFPGLQSLNLSRTALTDSGAKVLTKLLGLSSLDLSHTRITDGAIELLLPMSNLRELRLYLTGITNDGVGLLLRFPNLEQLDIGGTKLSDLGLAALSAHGSLRSLDLFNTELTDGSAKHLAKISGLKSLNIGATKITDNALNELSVLDQLTSLDLGLTKVSDRGLSLLRRFKSLSKLDLMGTPISDEGMKELCALPLLTNLTIWDTPITDNGLKTLANLKLTALDIENTKITDASADILSNFSSLRILFCSQDQLSSESLKMLKAKNPSLRIVGAEP